MPWSQPLRTIAEALGAAPPSGDGANAAVTGVSTDTRAIQPGELFVALKGESFDGNAFVDEALAKGAAAAVATVPGKDSGRVLVVEDGLAALQKLAAWHRAQFDIPVFALTGSCGKTTTKDLVAGALAARFNVVKTKGNLNNEIGLPLSLLRMDATTEMAVMEMGANHQGEIARLCEIARPTESAITMIGEAHLEGFGGTLADVAKAKGEIMQALPNDGTFYANQDDPHCKAIGEAYGGRVVSYGTSGDVVLEQCGFDEHGELALTISPIGGIRLPVHTRAWAHNILLAVAVALDHGVDEVEEPLREACEHLSRVTVTEIGPLRVLDDSYNANPASMRAAFQTLADLMNGDGGKRIAALGEMKELGEASPALHRQTGATAAEFGITHCYCYGPHAADFAEGARSAGIEAAEALDTHEAIAGRIAAVAAPGDMLLVKGSRGVTMEKVMDALRAHYG